MKVVSPVEAANVHHVVEKKYKTVCEYQEELCKTINDQKAEHGIAAKEDSALHIEKQAENASRHNS